MLKRPLAGLFVLMVCSGQLLAEDKPIQVFVNQSGKIVFTNTVEENAPILPSAAATPPSGRGVTLLRDEMPASIVALVESISNNHGVDPNLVSAMMKTESNFNRWAVSPKGARGLMQLIPATGRRFGVQDFFDPKQNIEGAVRYLKFLLEKFDGSVELSLAAYNAGENLVERLGRIPPIAETRDYVRKISALYKRPTATLVASAPKQAAPVAKSVLAAAAPEPASIYRSVDQDGVVHFSNIGPLN